MRVLGVLAAFLAGIVLIGGLLVGLDVLTTLGATVTATIASFTFFWYDKLRTQLESAKTSLEALRDSLQPQFIAEQSSETDSEETV